jgi:formate/nitrite transporter FocA (FNT family)
VSVAPDPPRIFARAVEEGERRLDQSLLELVATSFIAGFTVVFGVVALGLVHAAFHDYGGVAHVAGSLAFGTGMVFLIVGRSELFNENFFDPVAALVEDPSPAGGYRLLRLWVVTFALNLVGGALFVWILSVEGALPAGAVESLRTFAVEFSRRTNRAEFAKGIAGGALVSLLSFLLQAVDGIGSRAALAYVVGFLLALGPFDHVVVTVLHVLFGVFLGVDAGLLGLAETTAVVTAGNLVGGLGLVTLTHVAQVKGADEDG